MEDKARGKKQTITYSVKKMENITKKQCVYEMNNFNIALFNIHCLVLTQIMPCVQSKI